MKSRKERIKMMSFGMILMMGFGLIVPLLLIAVVAYALGWRLHADQTGQAQISQTPLEILKARYARGEISREEYDRMHRDLES
jgi:putative membrane protein